MQYIGGKAVLFVMQNTPVAKTATGTLTAAELLTAILNVTSAAAVSLTLPTGTLLDAAITAPALPINGCFEWSVINTGSSTGIVTLVAGVGHTIVGSATVAVGASQRYLTRKTVANTYVTYTIA